MVHLQRILISSESGNQCESHIDARTIVSFYGRSETLVARSFVIFASEWLLKKRSYIQSKRSTGTN
jgi:hypothetical protein